MANAVVMWAVVAGGWDGMIKMRKAVVEEMVTDGESIDRYLECPGDFGFDVDGCVVWRK